MTQPLILQEPVTSTSPVTLDELFEAASALGRVRVYTSEAARHPRRYHVAIEFETIPGTRLEAKSDFNLPIHDAFSEAIKRANAIRAQFK